MGVEVAHDVVFGEGGFEDGGDVGCIFYSGWVQGEWHA